MKNWQLFLLLTAISALTWEVSNEWKNVWGANVILSGIAASVFVIWEDVRKAK